MGAELELVLMPAEGGMELPNPWMRPCKHLFVHDGEDEQLQRQHAMWRMRLLMCLNLCWNTWMCPVDT